MLWRHEHSGVEGLVAAKTVEVQIPLPIKTPTLRPASHNSPLALYAARKPQLAYEWVPACDSPETHVIDLTSSFRSSCR